MARGRRACAVRRCSMSMARRSASRCATESAGRRKRPHPSRNENERQGGLERGRHRCNREISGRSHMYATGRAMLVSAGALVIATPYELAASAETGFAALEEVVVTARKRDEASLDVPVAINVFTAAEIASAGIERPQDFIALTPNMSLVQTQNQGTSFVTVRGISQARNSEPSVAVLIDGVLMANPSQFNQELIDIESIEVL